MGVDDPGQQLMGVPLHGALLRAAPGMLMFGTGADSLAARASSHPRALGRACSYPAGKDGVLQGAREEERKQEVVVA